VINLEEDCLTELLQGGAGTGERDVVPMIDSS